MYRVFTLVELAIVLMIVGLLTGGILASNSMIETARINKTISILQQLHIQIHNFKSTYKYYPGDLPNAYDYFGDACGNNQIQSAEHFKWRLQW